MKLIHKFNPVAITVIGFLSWFLVPISSSVYCNPKDYTDFYIDRERMVVDWAEYNNFINSLSGFCEFYNPIYEGFREFKGRSYMLHHTLFEKELIYLTLFTAFVAILIQFIYFYFAKIKEEELNKNNTVKTIINYQLLLILGLYLTNLMLYIDINF